MVVIATLVIISFAFWGNQSLFDRKGGDVVDEVYGKKITREELERMGNQEKVYMALRCGYHEALATAAEGGWHQQEDDRDLSIFNALVFEHEADVMGIGTTEQEVEEELAKRAGRPSLTGTSAHSPHVSFRIPPELKARAEEAARERGTTVSKLAREAFEAFLAS